LSKLALLLSALLHAGLLWLVATWGLSIDGAEPAAFAATNWRNEAALIDEPADRLAPIELPTVVTEAPLDPKPDEPLAEDLEDSVEPLPIPSEAAEPLLPIELDAPPILHLRISRSPPAAAPPEAAAPQSPPQVVAPDDAAAIADYAPEPVYPRKAVRLGLSGTVVLLALVKANGVVEACEVESSSGHESLDQSAREALRRWRFRPRVVDGQPRPFTARVPFQFIPRESG